MAPVLVVPVGVGAGTARFNGDPVGASHLINKLMPQVPRNKIVISIRLYQCTAVSVRGSLVPRPEFPFMRGCVWCVGSCFLYSLIDNYELINIGKLAMCFPRPSTHVALVPRASGLSRVGRGACAGARVGVNAGQRRGFKRGANGPSVINYSLAASPYRYNVMTHCTVCHDQYVV